MKVGCVVVIKSTVPVGTGLMIKELIAAKSDRHFYLVNNPEFLKEGSAIEDFMRPDRVIIGSDDQFAANKMDELYAPLVRQGNPIYHMSNVSAEMTKYAANCFLATKISFINEMAKLCDFTGADIEEVRKGISSDQRIGKHFLYPGPGYGGSCFPKDVKALIHTASEHDMKLSIVQAAEDVNDAQKTRMFDKMMKHYNGDVSNKSFAFWGVAFKANTDDIRETPAIYMARALTKAGAKVNFFDPVASTNYEEYMKSFPECEGKLKRCDDMYEALDGVDALVTMTEWRQFHGPNFDEIKKRLNEPVIFDARNLYPTKKILTLGFTYYAIGKYIRD
jgi:UDPglucose 6-dehydrogenase